MYQSISPNFYPTSHMVQEILKLEIPDFNLQTIFMNYITGTCRYHLTVLLNEINSIVEPLDPLKSVVNNVQNVTVLRVKRTIKSYLLQKYSYYCIILNCYVFQHYVV